MPHGPPRGAGFGVANHAGRLGAWLADMSYFLLGYSVWWCIAVCLRQWLALLTLRLRGDGLRAAGQTGLTPDPAHTSRFLRERWAFWLGLALLLYASTTLESTRLYRIEASLPGHSGGALGYLLGVWSTRWLGFTGSGLVAIVLGLVWQFAGVPLFLAAGSRAAGAWGYSFFEYSNKRELAKTQAEDLAKDLAKDLELGSKPCGNARKW